MPEKDSQETTRAFEQAILDQGERYYVLRLCVTGITPKSVRAIENIKQICEDHLKGYYELEVIDLYQEPSVVIEEDIVAAPTLIRRSPLPQRKLVGDLSRIERVLTGLDIDYEEKGRRDAHERI